MNVINRKNYLLIEEFLEYMSSTKGRAPGTISRYRSWLKHPLAWANEMSFANAQTIIPSFKKYVDALPKPLALESQKKLVETTRLFFRWAKLHYPREFAKLEPYWIDDLIPPRVDRANSNLGYVNLEEAIQLATLPVEKTNLALWRDQAATAMLFLSGARPGAFVTLPIRAVHLDTEHPSLQQWPEWGVHTKRNKKTTTFLFKIPELFSVVQEWDAFIRKQCPPDYPWYAPIKQIWGEQRISSEAPGKNREIALAKRIRLFYSIAGLPYKNPHKFRHGYTTYGLAHCHTMQEFQALSRNIMHANITITDTTYAHLEEHERAKILENLQVNPVNCPDEELKAIFRNYQRMA